MAIEYEKTVTSRVSDKMYDEIEAFAKAEIRPISNMVRFLLTEALHYRKLGIGPNEFEEFMKSRKK